MLSYKYQDRPKCINTQFLIFTQEVNSRSKVKKVPFCI